MKKIFLFTLFLFTIVYAKTEDNQTVRNIHNNIIGVYEPTKRECGAFKGFYCEEGITQFEFIKGKQLASNEKNKLEFIVWIARYIKDTRPIDKLNLTTNGAYVVPVSQNTINLNKIIILEESKKDIAKIQFLDYNQGIFTFGYKENPAIIHFKRISKEQDKYIRHYPKKK